MAKRKAQGEAGSAPSSKRARPAPPASDRVTRSASRIAAVHAVFLTTELLENVLRFLPMKDLLLDQRVCRKWRIVIRQSRELQQNLFMIPREPEHKWRLQVFECHEDGFQVWNALKVPGDYVCAPLESAWPLGELNPLLGKLAADRDKKYGIVYSIAYGGSECFDLHSRPADKHAEASWRRMFLTQPPIAEWYYHWTCILDATGEESDIESGTVLENHPATMADVVAKIQEHEQKLGGRFTMGSAFMAAEGIVFQTGPEGRYVEMEDIRDVDDEDVLYVRRVREGHEEELNDIDVVDDV